MSRTIRRSSGTGIADGSSYPENDNLPDRKQYIDGALLLDKIVATLNRFLVLPPHAAETIALWVLFTHTMDAWENSPRLILNSPGPGSGKSRTLNILEILVAGGQKIDDTTEAYIARIIDANEGKPFTLLLDEADTSFRERKRLKQLLNAGFDRGGKAGRVKTDSQNNYVPEALSLFAPIAIAGIRLDWTWPALLDRSLVFKIKKKLPHEVVEDFSKHRIAEVQEVGRQAAQWARSNLTALKNAQTDIPNKLQNRERDKWRPLLTIAGRAGGQWPQRARQIALALSAGTTEAFDGSLLLSKIRKIFDERSVDKIRSQDLVEALWAHGLSEYADAKALAKALKGFDIAPGQMKFDGVGAKGYRRADFEDAWSRYVDG